MKIGILTFWNVPNYGSFLQAYALQKYLSSHFVDDDVKQIAYINKLHYRTYYKVINVPFVKLINPRCILECGRRLKDKNKINNLKKFISYYDSIPHTKSLNKKTLQKETFDLVILGSDIVWDYSVPFFGKDKFLFGNNLNSRSVASFAASFGTSKSVAKAPEYVKTGLKNLKKISVRDINSKKLVSELVNREATVVCDPTYLWDFNSDENIVKPDEPNKYILVYGTYFDDSQINQLLEYKKKENIKLICINSLDDDNNWCDEIINQDQIDPFSWAGYFKYAEAVMTCTFHGLMFSLIFNKPIIFNPIQFMLDKAESFIKYLHLDDLLLKKNDVDYLLNYDWNNKYKEVNNYRDLLKKESISFIKSAVDNKYEQK